MLHTETKGCRQRGKGTGWGYSSVYVGWAIQLMSLPSYPLFNVLFKRRCVDHFLHGEKLSSEIASSMIAPFIFMNVSFSKTLLLLAKCVHFRLAIFRYGSIIQESHPLDRYVLVYVTSRTASLQIQGMEEINSWMGMHALNKV